VKIKSFIYCLALIAYSLSLFHSVIPHHHFDSLSEFKSAHSHEEGQQNHHEHRSESDTPDSGLFFNTHIANVDFLPSILALHKNSASKNLQIDNAAILQNTFLIDVWIVDKIFHIPIKPPRQDYFLSSSRLLRAPPILS